MVKFSLATTSGSFEERIVVMDRSAGAVGFFQNRQPMGALMLWKGLGDSAQGGAHPIGAVLHLPPFGMPYAGA